MQKKLQAFINVVLFGVMITVNALANILPINGYNTGQVSAFYPNFFVPAGFTFSIWGLIYILLLGYLMIGVFLAFTSRYIHADMLTEKVNPPFQITCLLNAGWILAWHYLHIELSLLIMVFLLISLIKIYGRIRPLKFTVNIFARLWLYHAFVVYLAWICVATIANTVALLVDIGWGGGPISAQLWAILMISLALLLGVFFVGRLKEPAFGFVLAWAFLGIYYNQLSVAKSVSISAAVSCCFLFPLAITILIKTPKKTQ